MGYVDDIVNDLDQLAVAEIMKYAVPTLDDYNDITSLAIELGKKLGANLDVIKLGVRFIHIKLGEAVSKKKKTEYINLGVEFAKDFLTGYPLSEEFKDKILACIKEQDDKKFTCMESEICANASHCNYLTPKKIFKRFYNLHDRGYSFGEAFLLVDEKAEEKWNKVTLDICKERWGENYKKIREFIEAARKHPYEFVSD